MEVIKANDIAKPKKAYYRLTFDEAGLAEIEAAKETDFPDLMVQEQGDDVEMLKAHVLVSPQAQTTASEAATALRITQGRVSYLFNHHPAFVKRGRDGHRVFYGVKAPSEQSENPEF